MKKVEAYIPKLEDLCYRMHLLSDDLTMKYNHDYGGTIDFNEEKWQSWYDRWINKDNRYYAYLRNENKEFIGEISYRLEGDKYICSIIIENKYRHNGYGKLGLDLLCKIAKENKIKYLYDDIAKDNSSINLFLSNGFEIEYEASKIIMVKKIL